MFAIFFLFGLLFFITNVKVNKQTENSMIVKAEIVATEKLHSGTSNGMSYIVYTHTITYVYNSNSFFGSIEEKYYNNDSMFESYVYIYIDSTTGEIIRVYDDNNFLNAFNALFIVFGSVSVIVFVVFGSKHLIEAKKISDKYGKKQLIDNPLYYEATKLDFVRYFFLFSLYGLVFTLTFINPLKYKMSSDEGNVIAEIIEMDVYTQNSVKSSYYLKCEYEYNNEINYFDIYFKNTTDSYELGDQLELNINQKDGNAYLINDERTIVYFIFAVPTLLALLFVLIVLFKYCCFSKKQIYGYKPFERDKIITDLEKTRNFKTDYLLEDDYEPKPRFSDDPFEDYYKK